jgi:hypothetical protein
MPFVATSITIYYEHQQDRLNFLFIDADEQRLTGALTRRLLKALLKALPDLLRSSASPSQLPIHQQQIQQMKHEQAQQQVAVAYGEVRIEPDAEKFLVETLTLTKLADETIRLMFLDASKAQQATLTLSLDALHKILGEALVKVPDWNLTNPWREPDQEKVVH